MQPESPDHFASYLTFPGWLANAYEDFSSERGVKSKTKLLPSLTIVELNAIASALYVAQQQLLLDPLNPVNLRSDEIAASLALNLYQSGSKIRRALEELPSLRLLVSSVPKAVPSRIFIGEQWTKSKENECEVALEVSPVGQELILGYANGYLDLLRRLSGEVSSCEFLGENSPLQLQKPVWLELSGIEQLVYFRIEKAVQWEAACVHLDGVFSTSLKGLFSGQRLALKARDSLDAELIERLRVLSRLGKKLTEHGVVARAACSQDFLAIQEYNDAALVWQLCDARLTQIDDPHYQARVLKTFAKSVAIEGVLERLLRILSMGSVTADEASRIANQLRSLWAQSDLLPMPMRISQNLLVDPILLLLEWRFRSNKLHPIPIGEPTGDVREILAMLPDNFMGAVDRFLTLTTSMPELEDSLRADVNLTFANTAFRGAILDEYAGTLRHRNNAEGAPSDAKKSSSFVLKADGASDRVLKPQDNATEARLRRTASEELERMQRSDRSAYDALRSKYIASLDERSRRVMVDIQRKMQPGVFEDHLKHRLIKYMIECPSSWRASRSIPI